MQKLPGNRPVPEEFTKLDEAIGKCVAKVRQTRPTVQQVKRNLDVLRDGIRLLQAVGAELTGQAVEKVIRVTAVRDYQWAQLKAFGVSDAEVLAAGERLQQHLDAERPWREIVAIEPDLETIREAYKAQRRELLGRQETEAEAARSRVRQRSGFSTLTSEQSHRVFRPLTEAVDNTTEEAVAPSLAELVDPFAARLQRCEDAANEILDEILSDSGDKLVRRVPINLRNRVINDQADIDALVEEIRKELTGQLEAGVKIRIV